MHSSPLPLIARLHRSHANLSHYINNGLTFSGQTLYMSVSILIIHSILTYYIFLKLTFTAHYGMSGLGLSALFHLFLHALVGEVTLLSLLTIVKA